MTELNKIWFKTLAIFLLVLVPLSYNGILVFKHICQSSNTVKIYFFVNNKCYDVDSDLCCYENNQEKEEPSCCEKSDPKHCEETNKNDANTYLITTNTCCFDEIRDIAITTDILNKDKFSPIIYQSVFFTFNSSLISNKSELQFLSKLNDLNYKPPVSNIIDFIHLHSEDKSSDSFLS